jgi:hypothetical protein
MNNPVANPYNVVLTLLMVGQPVQKMLQRFFLAEWVSRVVNKLIVLVGRKKMKCFNIILNPSFDQLLYEGVLADLKNRELEAG